MAGTNVVDDRLAALEVEKAQLLALKEAGVSDANEALKLAVAQITTHMDAAIALAKAFKLDFTLPMGESWRTLTYSNQYDQFYDPNDYGWSSSSLGC